MGIYQTIQSLSGEQEKHFSQQCDAVESYFAQSLISLGVDLSTATLAKAAADSIDLNLNNSAVFTFLEFIARRPLLLAKFEQKTGLTVKNESLMTVARAATLPPRK